MSNTSINPIVVVKEGIAYRLDTMAYNVSTKGGIGGSMTALRGASAVVPGRSGSIWNPGRKRNEGMILLSMWAQDTDENGNPTGDQYRAWRENMDKLLWLFDTSNARVEIREYVQRITTPSTDLAGLPYRSAVVEVRDAIDPEVLGRVYGEFKVSCVINETYWQSSESIDESWFLMMGETQHDALIPNEGNAPIEDGVIIFSALVDHTVSNPEVVDVASGHSISLMDTTLNSGDTWTINCKDWTSDIEGVSVTAKTKARGVFAPRYFGLTPNMATGQSTIRARCTSSTGVDDPVGIITFEGKAKFH